MKSGDIAALYNQVPLGAVVQIIQDRLPKVPKASPLRSSNTFVAEKVKSQIQNEIGSTSASAGLTVEQMRTGGAVAAEREKAKLASNKRL